MEKLLFNLQLFAGEEQEEIEEEETPTEEVEEEVEETEEETDTEFDDSEEESVEEEEKPTQKEQNKINAQRRLEAKQNKINAQRRLEEKHKKEGYIKGVKEATNGINPYNNQPIEDEYDIEVYQTMVEMSKKGFDPIEDYAKYVAQKQREAQKAENDAKEKNLNEANEFVAKYGEETFKKIVEDEEFNEFCEDLLGNTPLVTIYEKFLKQQAKIEERAKELALKKDARRKSSTGGIVKQNAQEQSWENLEGADFRKFTEGIASRR